VRDLSNCFYDCARRIRGRRKDLEHLDLAILHPNTISEGAACIDGNTQQGLGSRRHKRASLACAIAPFRQDYRYNRSVEIRIREGLASEFEVLWRIDQLCFEPEYAYSRKELAHYMKLRGAFTLVGETRKSPRSKWSTSGFVVGQEPRRGLGHIITIDVLAEARRTGLGSHLMNEAENRMKQHGCDTIFLETAVDNAPAIQFYKRLNYFVVKTLHGYYSGKMDAFMMAKEVGPRIKP
jgi:ribosomal protein S18 acetylase RimI-like enzyme